MATWKHYLADAVLLRIGLVYFQFWPNVGGTEGSMVEYAKALGARGHSVTVLTTNAIRYRPRVLPSNETMDGFLIRRFKFVPLPFKYFFLAPGLVSTLLRERFDVIQVFSVIPSFFTNIAILVSRVKRTPVVLYAQFSPGRFQGHPSRLVRIAGTIFDLGVAPRILRACSFVISLSKRDAAVYRLWGVEHSTVFYELIPPRRHATADEIKRFRARFDGRDRLVLFVGRIDRRKGLDVLVRAFPTVLEKNPAARLVVVGKDYGYQHHCVSLAKELDCLSRVSFLGQVSDEDLCAAYESCEIVVVPSHSEAYSRVVAEAMFFRKPMVLTSRVALSEIITPENGLVIEPGSEQMISDAITRIFQTGLPPSLPGKRRFHVTFLDADEAASQLTQIYQDLTLAQQSLP